MTTIVEWMNGIMTGRFRMKADLADTIDGIAALVCILMIAIGVNG